MKKSIVTLLVVALVGSTLAGSALAGKKKKGKKAKPVATTLFAHGPSPVGEVDGANWFTNLGSAPAPLTLDTTEPSNPFPKSQNFMSPALNDQCTGLPVAFPTFQGDLSGTIVGDVKMTSYFLSAPAKVTARIWADVTTFNCNDGYIEPASEVVVDVPPGQSEVEIVFEDLKLETQSWVLVEILALSGTDYKGEVGRLLYDSPSAATRLEFNCVPAAGAKSCAP